MPFIGHINSTLDLILILEEIPHSWEMIYAVTYNVTKGPMYLLNFLKMRIFSGIMEHHGIV